jgi:hypothetical protein
MLAIVFASAQEKTTVKASVDKNKILIGEQLVLTLEANIPQNEPIRFFYIDTIPHFEFIAKPPIDTTNTSDGTILRQAIRITSFDSGHWVIPAFVLGEQGVTDSIPIDVVFSDFNPEQDYHDIKDIIEVEPKQEKKNWWTWYAVGGGLLLIILLLILLRKKKPVVQPVAPPIDAFTEAMQKLEKLNRGKLDPKEYYSQLVDIFRVYVLKKKGIHSLQNTTDDLVVQLRGIPVAREQFEKLAQALRLSDFVKFAKYNPSVEDDRQVFDTIKATITLIEEIK